MEAEHNEIPEEQGASASGDPEEDMSEEQAQAEEQIARLQRWFHLGYEPRMTKWLVGANIGVFVAMVTSTGLQSVMVPSVQTMLDWGALYGPDALYGQYWRMLTSMFLHAGVFHLAINMYVLWFAGRIVEGLYGSAKFLAIYLLAGLGGSLGLTVFSTLAVGVGASGAVFGVFGALLSFLHAHRSEFPPRLFAEKLKGLLFFLGINLVYGFTMPGIGNAAHIGGLAFGYIAGLAVMPGDPRDLRWHGKDSLRIAGMVLALALVLYVAKLGMLDFGGELALGRGLKMLDDHRYADAVRYFNQRIARNGADDRAYLGRAIAFSSLDQHRKAVEDCDKILSIDPKNVRALLTRAASYGKLGEHGRSIDDLNKALSLERDHPGAYALRGWDHLALGNYQQAIEDYTQALSMAEGLDWVYNSRAYTRFIIGDRKGAIADEQKFLKAAGWTDESAPYAVIVSALSYRFLGQQDAADKMLAEGAAHLNHASWPYAVIQYLRHEISADQLQSRAVDNDKMTEVKTYVGLDLVQQGKNEEARPYFEWVVQHGNKEFYEYPIARAQLEGKTAQ